MKLTNNAFAALGAMPRDDKRILNEKADEAALLGGDNPEEALSQLMQMNRRIPAEIGWLPDSTSEAANAFLEYARAIEEGKPAPIPPLNGIGTPLAQANALSSLFEIWPTDEPELFIGLCRTLDGIIAAITVEDTLRAINADRASGGWEIVADGADLAGPLNSHLRALCEPLSRAISDMDTDIAAAALKELFSPGGIDVQGEVAQAVSDAYSMHIHEKAQTLRAKMQSLVEEDKTASWAYLSALRSLQKLTAEWDKLTAPLRLVPGAFRNEAKGIGISIRGLLVEYVNNAGTVEENKEFTMRTLNGTRTVTVRYKSQSDSVQQALKVIEWLRRTFPEQGQLLDLLQGDEKQLNDILESEKAMLRRAELEANAKLISSIRLR